MLTSQNMLTNYRNAIKNGAFVSTDAVTLLSVVKRENFDTATKHFAESESLITQLVQISVKLEATKHFLILQKYYIEGKIQQRPWLTTFTKDKDFHKVLTMFLGDNYKRDDVIILSSMVEDSLLSAYCKIM